ncbi:orphan sodium- and chloride-dependent neurotransmitter transporter NTT5 [Rhinolophus sinicus]|uniref:orphan sodium- and chloride-dependent neurotransmitter transporter NTT5 n=1 Tax=Rhinolophus sinicus TaxID=89399 RepID=UPI003D7AF333
MRSTQEGRPFLEKAEAATESLPGKKTESQSSESSWETLSFTESTLLENFPERQTQENKGTAADAVVAWLSEATVLEAQTGKPQAWKTPACEVQDRFNQLRQTSVSKVEAAQVLKQEPLPEKVEVPEKEKSEVLFTRPLWSNKVEYILAQVGYSVNAISLWRFFNLWLQNGGCFLIMYIVLLFLVGIPLLLLEMAAGQRMRQGSIGVWKIISPRIGGVGYTSFMVCFIVGLYCNVFNTWILTYLSHSFQFPAAWEHCPLLMNSSDFDPECANTTPFLYFWYRVALKVSDRIEDGGSPVDSLILSFLVSWCLVGAFVINGLKYIGKVMYVLVPVPHFIMLCFLIRSLQLDGAKLGLGYLVVGKISAIYSVNAWCQTGLQVLFSLGLGYGSVVSLASHMNLANNCLSDAFVVALINLGAMLLATTVFFCVGGFWATILTHRCNEKNAETLSRLVSLGKLPPEAQPPPNLFDYPTSIFTVWLNSLPQSIKSMVLSHVPECSLQKQFLKVGKSADFAFLSFVKAMSFIPGSVVWSILFFLMFLILGLNFMIGILQGIITPLRDTFSSFRKHTKLLTAVVFVLMFLCGLFVLQPSGLYYVRLLNDYWVIVPVIIIITLENMAVGWAYGARRFLAELTILWDRPIHPVIRWLWCCLCPGVLLVLLAAAVYSQSQTTWTYLSWDSSSSKEVLQQFPSWMRFMMIILSFIVILPVPIHFVYSLTRRIPFKSSSSNRSVMSSKSQSLSMHLTPMKEVQKEEALQGNNQIAGSPVV